MDDTTQTIAPEPEKPRRGFALMDPNRLKAVSSKGGSAPHAVKRGFARLDEARRREVSQKGLEARRSMPAEDGMGQMPANDQQGL